MSELATVMVMGKKLKQAIAAIADYLASIAMKIA
jgi:hypothetical protein